MAALPAALGVLGTTGAKDGKEAATSGGSSVVERAQARARLAQARVRFRGAGRRFLPGDEVCWRGADGDLPRGTVGRVLMLHDGMGGGGGGGGQVERADDVEVLFPALGRPGGAAVFTFAATRLQHKGEKQDDSPRNKAPGSLVTPGPPLATPGGSAWGRSIERGTPASVGRSKSTPQRKLSTEGERHHGRSAEHRGRVSEGARPRTD